MAIWDYWQLSDIGKCQGMKSTQTICNSILPRSIRQILFGSLSFCMKNPMYVHIYINNLLIEHCYCLPFYSPSHFNFLLSSVAYILFGIRFPCGYPRYWQEISFARRVVVSHNLVTSIKVNVGVGVDNKVTWNFWRILK